MNICILTNEISLLLWEHCHLPWCEAVKLKPCVRALSEFFRCPVPLRILKWVLQIEPYPSGNAALSLMGVVTQTENRNYIVHAIFSTCTSQ